MNQKMNLLTKMNYANAHTSKDMSQNEVDAFLYGITNGWTDEGREEVFRIKREFSKKFGWTERDWAAIEALRQTFISMEKLLSLPSEEDRRERNLRLANDILELSIKYNVTDTRIYFNGIAYQLDSRGEFKVIHDIKAADYFEYADNESISMSFEGTLNHALNYGTNPDLESDLRSLFRRHNADYILGDAWNLRVEFL